MKNLNVIWTHKAKLDAKIVGQCIDADNKRFFLLTEDVKIFQVQGDQRNVRAADVSIKDKSNLEVTSLKRDEVVWIDYIVETGSICIGLEDGRIISIGVSTFSPPSCCVYRHSKQISSIKLSPDQDLLALADVDHDLFILDKDFSVVYSDNALNQADSAHKPVGVGWGSKETQFFGLDGRPSKEKAAKNQVILAEDELSAIDKIESSEIFSKFRQANARNTSVDWRGDGQLLATFTYIAEADKHYLKVWNRNLELQYMSEQLVTMERGLLSWIPNGQYVCATQRRDNRVNEIAMFEKNGMVHQRITLPTFIPHLYIRDLLWSPDSAILAIVCLKFELDKSEIRKRHMLMLYTMQNFHYYLKYSAYLSLGGDEYSLSWDPDNNNILYLSSDNGSCVEYNCISHVDNCRDDATTAVIDANKILITPFSICNIPPPMSAITVEAESLVSRLIIPTRNLAQMIVITTDDELIFLSSRNQDAKISPAKILNKLDNEAVSKFSLNMGKFSRVPFNSSHEYQNFMLIDRYSFIATREVENGSELVEISILDEEERPTISSRRVMILEGRDIISVVKDSYNQSSNSLSLVLDGLSCMRVDLTTGATISVTTPRSTSDRLYVKQTQYVQDLGMVLILTLDLNLLVDGNLLASNCCTSFRTTPNFLVYTTVDNMIHFVPLDKLSRNEDSGEVGSWNQPIENGGTLVIACEEDSRVILQMPRGNLEILRPRIMVLLRLIDLMDREEFVSAIKLARRYRVDLNFLIDYYLHSQKDLFTSDKLSKFANDIAHQNSELLNLFITELSHEDTTTGRYKSAMEFLPQDKRPKSEDEVSTVKNKVNNICMHIETHLDVKYLQPKILSLLKQEPRKSDKALKLVHALATKDEREAALKFMLYFISIEQLFVDAIATYDTDMALMVAIVSSKDPKEYLALLDSFNDVEHVYLRKYKMDIYIKNYEKAFAKLLAYLPDAPDQEATKEELLNMVVDKRIYKSAIKTCFQQFPTFVSLTGCCGVNSTFEELSMQIWTRYADYLLEKRCYLEAGLAYSKSLSRLPNDKKVENAVKCYLLADRFYMALALLERYELTPEKKDDLKRNILHNLISQGSYESSIIVLTTPKNDVLARELAQAGSWYLAELIATTTFRHELREEICSSISNEIDKQITDLTNCYSKAKDQYERLLVLLRTPRPTDQYDAENCYNADSLSTVDGSETTSILSGQNGQIRVARSGAPSIKTRTSTKSNKSKAAKRKKISLKVGSRHEDLALVTELKKFISTQRTVQKSVVDIIAAKIDFIDLHSCEAAQNRLAEVVKESHKLANEMLQNLWPKIEQEDGQYSVYGRFAKSLTSDEYVDNEDIAILLRPDLPSSCLLFEL